MSKTRSSQFYHPDDPEADAQMAPGNPAPLSTGQERAGMPDGYQPLGPITPGAPNAASMAQGQQRAGTPNYIDPNYRPAPLENQGPDIRMRTTGFLGGDTVQESRTAARDPIYMPQTAVPLFELQSNLDEVRANKRQLADWWGKQADQFDGVAAPQYDKAYQQWALGEQDRYVQQWADAYFDGDRGKAARHVYEDPEAQRRYRSFLRDLNASGVANKYYTKQAIDYIDGVNAGTTYMDPELYKEAQWFASGAADFGQGGDSAAMRADHAKTWDRLSSRDKMFNTMYHPQLANALEKLASTGGITRDPATGRLIFTEEARATWDSYKRQVAKELTNLYGTGTEAENMRFLDARLPDQVEGSVKVLPVGRSGGSGGSGGDGPKTMFTAKIIDASNTSGGTGAIIEFGAETGGKRVIVPPADISATRKGVTEGYRVFPERIEMTKDGDLNLIGRVAARPSEQLVTEAAAKGFSLSRSFEKIKNGTATDEEVEEYTRFVPLEQMQFSEEEIRPWVQQNGQTIDGLKQMLKNEAERRGKAISTSGAKSGASTRTQKVLKYNPQTDSFE